MSQARPDPGEARAFLQQYSEVDTVDLLIADVVMPRMGGVELAARVRDLQRGLRVLFMSGYTEHALVRQGKYAPGTVLLQKPFTARELLSKVSLAIHG